MNVKTLLLIGSLCLAVPAAYAADPAINAERTKAAKTKATKATPKATSNKRDGEGRKKYLEDRERKIVREYQDKTDKARDGQKGLANSGATQKKVDSLEKERDARKEALRDHYNKGPKAKGDN